MRKERLLGSSRQQILNLGLAGARPSRKYAGRRRNMKQVNLFPAVKPLCERFGAEFFRSAPRLPGVYIMTGESERVLYIGQSKNLRHRLGSYKNARRDRVARKIVRLVHEVR